MTAGGEDVFWMQMDSDGKNGSKPKSMVSFWIFGAYPTNSLFSCSPGYRGAGPQPYWDVVSTSTIMTSFSIQHRRFPTILMATHDSRPTITPFRIDFPLLIPPRSDSLSIIWTSFYSETLKMIN